MWIMKALEAGWPKNTDLGSTDPHYRSTGSVDYLHVHNVRTGPRTTPKDPSTDHPPNKIKTKTKKRFHLLLVQLGHLCQRNFAPYAGLRRINVTDLGSVSGASYVIADHYIFAIFVAVALHERSGSLRNLWFLSLRHFVYIWNCEAWTSSRTRGRIGRTTWQRKCTQSSTNFKASPRFPGLSYILIATAKKKMAMWNVNDLTCAQDWIQVCYIFPA